MTNKPSATIKEDKERMGNKDKDMSLEEVKEEGIDNILKIRKKKGKYNDRDKQIIGEKAISLMVRGKSVPEIALKLKIPRSSLYEIIASDELWTTYKKNKKQVLDSQFAELASRSLLEAHKRLKTDPSKIKYKDIVIGGAIAHDKIYPPFTQAQQFNISGQDMKVEMPQFFKPRKTHSHTE